VSAPILRWVGSKRRLAPAIGPRLLSSLAGGGRYYEPFAGSLALFLWLREKGWKGAATLSDACEPLINTYREIASWPGEVAGHLAVYPSLESQWERGAELGGKGRRGLYEHIRAEFNNPWYRLERWEPAWATAQAARLIYLNRRCFNGLYRTNAKGEFNTDFGGEARKTPMPTAEELSLFASSLSGAELRCSDFAAVVSEATEGDVVYADPPYNGTYTGYSASFGPKDQGRLAEALKGAVERGARVVTSNADTEYVRALYASWATVEELDLTYLVGGKKGRRPQAKELLISAGGGR
jgi:DNA adenine methylase